MDWETVLIAELRKMRGDYLTDRAMADDLGLHQPTLYRILEGQRGIGKDVLRQILDAKPEMGMIVASALMFNGDAGQEAANG